MQFEVSAAAGRIPPTLAICLCRRVLQFSFSGYFISSRRRLSSDDKREFQSSFDFI
jgi:hypothetical protein